MISITLYTLGVVGAVAAVSRDAPLGVSEWCIALVWPVSVAAGIAIGVCKHRRSVRP